MAKKIHNLFKGIQVHPNPANMPGELKLHRSSKAKKKCTMHKPVEVSNQIGKL